MMNKFILAIIALVCGLFVSSLNFLLKDQMEATKKIKDMAIKKSFYPEAAVFEENGNGLITAKNLANQSLGYLYYSEDSTGYSGKVKFVVALNLDGTIRDFLMYDHAETPGLGTQVNDPWFKKGFVGQKPLKENMPTGKKDFREKLGIDAISGATITSMAAVKAITNSTEPYIQMCLEKNINILEETFRQYDKTTFQNMNVLLKKKVLPPVTQNYRIIIPFLPLQKAQPAPQINSPQSIPSQNTIQKPR